VRRRPCLRLLFKQALLGNGGLGLTTGMKPVGTAQRQCLQCRHRNHPDARFGARTEVPRYSTSACSAYQPQHQEGCLVRRPNTFCYASGGAGRSLQPPGLGHQLAQLAHVVVADSQV
jgi:hypothetical protein